MSIIGESNKTGSLPIQTFSETQALILDFLFLGFT